MLDEGWRRHERGTDVVVGFVETHGRPSTRRRCATSRWCLAARSSYRGTTFEEMDVDAVLARRPAVALVDELAHTNVPGQPHEKRWQDVDELLDAGIDVITTVNIQHLECLNDVVEQDHRRPTARDGARRGGPSRRPDRARRHDARGAAPPHGARQHLPAEQVDAALANYFRPGNLAALRASSRCCGLPTGSRTALRKYMTLHDIDHPWETR